MTTPMDTIRRKLGRSTHEPAGRSAVLMLIVPIEQRPHVLLTLRSDLLASHPGELSFPGGRVEPADPSAQEAALRETEEETGILPRHVTPWGHLFDYTTYRNDRLSVFGGEVQPQHVPDPTPANDEVHRVLLVPFDSLGAGQPTLRIAHDHPATEVVQRRVHACDAASYYALSLDGRVIHYWPLLDGHVLWGITADLVAMSLERVLAWRPPKAARRVDSQAEVRPSRMGPTT